MGGPVGPAAHLFFRRGCCCSLKPPLLKLIFILCKLMPVRCDSSISITDTRTPSLAITLICLLQALRFPLLAGLFLSSDSSHLFFFFFFARGKNESPLGNERRFEGGWECVCACECMCGRQSQNERDCMCQICLQSAACLQGMMITK